MTYRKITEEDCVILYPIIDSAIRKHKLRGGKGWFKYLDLDAVMQGLYVNETYIVDDTYLVSYLVGTPWYADDSITYLEEKLVLRISDEGSSFSVVPAFLEDRRQAHGAVLVGVGTAFALSDRAMSKVYNNHGFHQEAVSLIKEA